jgi:cytochrome c peroxidase
MPPAFSDAGWNLHSGEEICTDTFQSSRSPTFRYRTTPLRGIVARSKRGFYHDGRYATLRAVVDHYDDCFKLGLSSREKADLVEYLRGR